MRRYLAILLCLCLACLPAPAQTIYAGQSIPSRPNCPANTIGVDNAWYLDWVTGNVYGPKTLGQWPCTPITSIFASGTIPGLVSDATGQPNQGTDNSAALQTALSIPGNYVAIPKGAYRFTHALTLAQNVHVDCAGREVTFLELDDPTGTSDGFILSTNDSFKHCNLGRTTNATAGALIHGTDIVWDFIEDNSFTRTWAGQAWNNLRFDCANGAGAGAVQHLFIDHNDSYNSLNDGILLNCPFTNASMADIFIEDRNYLQGNVHAGLEAIGSVGWLHVTNDDFDVNPLYGFLADCTLGSSASCDHINIEGSNHFEGNTHDVWWIGIQASAIIGADILPGVISDDGITCIGCVSNVIGSNRYSGNAGLTLNGSYSITVGPDTWSINSATRQGMVVINSITGVVNSGSKNISVTGGTFPFTSIPFVYIVSSSYPASEIYVDVNVDQGQCLGGNISQVTDLEYSCHGSAGFTQVLNQLRGSSIQSTGTAPTLTTGSCSGSSWVGGNTIGRFTAATCASGTYILTGLVASLNGYNCSAQDQTTTADTLKQTASTTTSCTLSGTTVSGDSIGVKALGY